MRMCCIFTLLNLRAQTSGILRRVRLNLHLVFPLTPQNVVKSVNFTPQNVCESIKFTPQNVEKHAKFTSQNVNWY